MTTNLTIPADVWACKQPGVPLVAAIVEGDEPHTRACGWRKHPHGPDCAPGCPTCTDGPRPPAWLVDLSDARCGNCRKIKGRWYHTRPDNTHRRGTCGRCHDGRLIHDVRVEALVSFMPSDWWGDGHKGPRTLPIRTEASTVRCLIDVVSITHQHDAILESTHITIGVDDVPLLWVMLPDGEFEPHQLPHVDALAAACGKPPADWVGGYAVILTEVRQ